MDMKTFLTYMVEGPEPGREIEVKGTFDRITIGNLHRKNPLRVGDVLISRKGERFRVAKIEDVKRHMAGKTWDGGVAIDIVGSNKGRVFTVYVR